MVSIWLLQAIVCFQEIPYYMNLVQSLINLFGNQTWRLSHVKPSNWKSTSPTIQGHKRSHTYRWIVTIVVRKLNQRKVFIPISLEINYTSSKHILKGLNSTFRLTIRLRMKSCAKLHLDTQSFLDDIQKLDVNLHPYLI